MEWNRLGLLGFVALVIAVVGVWHMLLGAFVARHRDNPLAQAAAFTWGVGGN